MADLERRLSEKSTAGGKGGSARITLAYKTLPQRYGDTSKASEGSTMDNAALTLHLFSKGWLYFGENDVAWDGSGHAIGGMQVDGSHLGELIGIITLERPAGTTTNEVCGLALDRIKALSDDSELKIPRDRVAPGIASSMREGDLTAVTLVELAGACNALAIKQVRTNTYRVTYDPRLELGIPAFPQVTARVLWLLRSKDDERPACPFNISFEPLQNMAGANLGMVRGLVRGGKACPLDVMTVIEEPHIKLA